MVRVPDANAKVHGSIAVAGSVFFSSEAFLIRMFFNPNWDQFGINFPSPRDVPWAVSGTVLVHLKGGHWIASGRSQGQKRQKAICPWDVATDPKSRPRDVSGITVCYLGHGFLLSQLVEECPCFRHVKQHRWVFKNSYLSFGSIALNFQHCVKG